MRPTNNRGSRGFSLLELVIVVVIIAIIAAIAVPRLSRGTAGAADSALAGDLAVLRNALDLYSAEHTGAYPTEANVVAALTTYTDAVGGTAVAKDATHIYGPYVRQIPALPVGAKKGSTGVASVDAAGVGWIYTPATGAIKANCADGEIDDSGKKYNEY